MTRLKQVRVDDLRLRAEQSRSDLFPGERLDLIPVSFSDPYLQILWKEHYVGSGGAIGRQLHYLVYWAGRAVGAISAGSAMWSNKGRDRILGVTEGERRKGLLHIACNTIFRLDRPKDQPPLATDVLKLFRERSAADWLRWYGNHVRAFETTVEPPRWGGVYKLDGWVRAGRTAGVGCRRPKGHGLGNPRKVVRTTKKIVWVFPIMSYQDAKIVDEQK